MLTTPRLKQAYEFANLAHSTKSKTGSPQLRKYSGLPYVTHSVEVMEIVSRVSHTEDMLIAALLHDVVEDTTVTLNEIRFIFGYAVADLVEMLTDAAVPEDGNRAVRMSINRKHSAKATPNGKTIKLADLISNTKSIVANDLAFARVYLEEKALLLLYLEDGDATLLAQAYTLLQAGQEEIMRRSLDENK